MNIAVLISGEYREFEISYPSWRFDECGTVDYFFSTWSETSEVNARLNINISEAVTIDRIKKHLPITDYIISDSIDLPNQQQMINRWQEGLKLIKNSGKTYDSIIVIRPDLYIEYGYLFYHFITNISSNTFYCYCDFYKGELKNVIDQIFIGDSNTILKLIDIDTSVIKHNTNIHNFLADYFNTLFESVKVIPFSKYYIVRSNSRGLDSYSYEIIKANSIFWYEQKHLLETVIAEFKGFSDSHVTLIENSFGKQFVRKQKNVQRNYDKMKLLYENGYNVPKIIDMQNDTLDMEYISGIDMKTFLLRNDVKLLANFIIETIDKFKETSTTKNYADTYITELKKIDYSLLPFTYEVLYTRIPADLPQSLCHGDFTLENIIYSNGNFYMLDTVTGPYDSWVFDIAKMRQDIDGRWFLRNTNTELTVQLKILRDILQEQFSTAFDNYFYIVMLLRVYKHCKVDTKEHRLILEEITRIWK